MGNKFLANLLPRAVEEIEKKRAVRPDLILAAWHALIDEKWGPMTEPISFEKGAVVVKVRGAALYATLVQQEKKRLLKKLQEKFPAAGIKNIIFRVG